MPIFICSAQQTMPFPLPILLPIGISQAPILVFSTGMWSGEKELCRLPWAAPCVHGNFQPILEKPSNSVQKEMPTMKNTDRDEFSRGKAFSGRSFTLIELLVVVAVISLLAALLLPALK